MVLEDSVVRWLLEKRANADGTYALDWTQGQAPWKVGKRKSPING